MPYTATKQDDPLKALLRERDLETLKKKLLKEWGIIRLRTLEGLVESQGHRLVSRAGRAVVTPGAGKGRKARTPGARKAGRQRTA